MVRWFVMVLLAMVCVVFLGCAHVGSATSVPEAIAPANEASEPNAAPAQIVEQPTPVEPVQAPPESATSEPSPTEVNEPPVQAQPVPDVNVPSVPDPNAAIAVSESDQGNAEPEASDVQPEEPSLHPTSNIQLQTSFYSPYAQILATYVREDGLVNYGELRRRRLDLKPILAALDELDPNVYRGWSAQEKLAFWIDAYNLKMLDIVARNYPIESSWWLRLTWPPSDIRHITGIWTDYKFLVMDEEFTLAEVEQRFFRTAFDDPRVWLALTYACQSSPPLRREPYGGEEGSGSVEADKRGSGKTQDRLPASTLPRFHASTFPSPSDLDRQLDAQVRRFLASPQGLQIDRRNGVVRLSALFKPNWRGKEFIARYGTDRKFKAYDPATRAVLNFLMNYLSAEDIEFLEVENYSLEYLNFDWRLNDTDKGY